MLIAVVWAYTHNQSRIATTGQSTSKERTCEALRDTTGKPYEFIEATLTFAGGMLSASSTVDYAVKPTESQRMQEIAAYEAVYENNQLGKFTVSFGGTVASLLPHNEAFHGVQQPRHRFCAYKSDTPLTRTDYIGDINTLKMEESGNGNK